MRPDPLFVRWTILPAPVIARAWTDPGFRDTLLAEPDPTLRTIFRSVPGGVHFKVIADEPGRYHLPLPCQPQSTRDWSIQRVRAQLLVEVDDESFEWSLPPVVILRAFFDPGFRLALLRDADAALTACGYVSRGRVVVANKANLHHLVLPLAPTDREAEIDRAERLAAAFRPASA
jgi:hypothetical protein